MSFLGLPLKALGILALLLAFSTTASALELGEAKADGLVGETSTGYLAAIKPSGEVGSLMSDINGKRKAYYQEIADKNGISLRAVEELAGKKAIEKTPSGEFVNTGAGWQKK